MLRLKVFGSLFIFLFSVSQIFATAQAPDKIIYNGKEYKLHTNPMDAYFLKFPDKKPNTGIISSGLWRGYIATFEIADNALYLKDIEKLQKVEGAEKFETEMKSFFSDIVPAGKKLKVDWFTGILVLPYGKVVNYIHMGYASTYENYILLEIESGDFKKSKEFNAQEYAKFKERQYAAFRKTAEYTNLVEKMKKEKKYTDEFVDTFIKNWVVEYSSKILVD
jgi:hypothetical protein